MVPDTQSAREAAFDEKIVERARRGNIRIPSQIRLAWNYVQSVNAAHIERGDAVQRLLSLQELLRPLCAPTPADEAPQGAPFADLNILTPEEWEDGVDMAKANAAAALDLQVRPFLEQIAKQLKHQGPNGIHLPMGGVLGFGDQDYKNAFWQRIIKVLDGIGWRLDEARSRPVADMDKQESKLWVCLVSNRRGATRG